MSTSTSLRGLRVYIYVRSNILIYYYYFRSETKSVIRRRQKDEKVDHHFRGGHDAS